MNGSETNAEIRWLEAASTSPVDELLHHFFQAEAPVSWPVCPAPSTSLSFRGKQIVAQPWASRAALAASVAIILAGHLWLGHLFRSRESLAPGGAPAALEAKDRRPYPKPSGIKPKDKAGKVFFNGQDLSLTPN